MVVKKKKVKFSKIHTERNPTQNQGVNIPCDPFVRKEKLSWQTGSIPEAPGGTAQHLNQQLSYFSSWRGRKVIILESKNLNKERELIFHL